jgi:ubiquinone/menaquinone biosynthesis C-methylase UbiE
VSGADWPFPVEQQSSAIASIIPAAERAADYDRIAGLYDRIVGARWYNRLVWGADTRDYADAARAALAGAAGPALDVGCGSLVFTAEAYRAAGADLLLTDRSMAMLERAAARLPDGRFLQADAFSLPFADGTFACVMSWGMLHLFGSRSSYLSELRRLAAPGARVHISMLVLTDRKLGNAMLRRLHKAGEAATPETPDQATAAFSALFTDVAAVRRSSMLLLSGSVPLEP